MSRGLDWEDLEDVLGEEPDYFAEDRFARRGWAGPPGHCWRFWQVVWQLRRERQGEKAPVLG